MISTSWVTHGVKHIKETGMRKLPRYSEPAARKAAAKLESNGRRVQVVPPFEQAPDSSGTASVWRVLHTVAS